METPVAALIANSSGGGMAERLRTLLEFFGVPLRQFASLSDFRNAIKAGPLRSPRYSIIGPITQLSALFDGEAEQDVWDCIESIFCYLGQDVASCSRMLKTILKSSDAALVPLGSTPVELDVTGDRDITGPMHGQRAAVRPRPSDYALATEDLGPISQIIGIKDYQCFFELKDRATRTFVNCSTEVPDLKSPLKGRYYDVKEDFLSAVPIVTYLKWAFRDCCWQNSQPGACLIIDDPVLKTRYGFCDFREIDNQMREFGFSTNISFIPWNWRRTSQDSAELIRNSNGRFSISIHGCDHTSGEFGTSAVDTLHRKVALARQRMKNHQTRNNLPYDPIMVFPQGVFSRESLGIIQQHQFLAAVNTDVSPVNGNGKPITVGDVWSVAILKYGSFPLFTRRYPNHGLENFAFDLLLGKPCLIVEHHEFFKGGGREATKFVSALNSLNCRLQWRSLGEVVRRSYQWRVGPEHEIQVKMFANELILQNREKGARSYKIQKANEDSAGVDNVLINGRPVKWEADKSTISFTSKIPPKTEISIQVKYRSSLGRVTGRDSIKGRTTTAMRRYSSEFRDTILSSRHASLMFVAQKVKSYLANR